MRGWQHSESTGIWVLNLGALKSHRLLTVESVTQNTEAGGQGGIEVQTFVDRFAIVCVTEEGGLVGGTAQEADDHSCCGVGGTAQLGVRCLSPYGYGGGGRGQGRRALGILYGIFQPGMARPGKAVARVGNFPGKGWGNT